MRIWVAAALLSVAGCTSSPNSTLEIKADPSPQVVASAYFTEYPGTFFDAVAFVCNTPRDTLVRQNADQIRCESLPDPEIAAALILRHNGTVEEIPTFVVAFNGEQQSAGYLITVDNYIRIPQRTGETQHLRFPDSNAQEGFQALLERAGGRPL